MLHFEVKECFVRINGVTFRTPTMHSCANKCFNFVPINGVTFHTPVLHFEVKGCFVRINGFTFHSPALHSSENKCFNLVPINGITFHTPALHFEVKGCFVRITGVTFRTPALHSSPHKCLVPINGVTFHTPVLHVGSKKGVVLCGLIESLNGTIAKIPATLLCENVSCYAYELIQSLLSGTLTSKLNSKVKRNFYLPGRLTNTPHPPFPQRFSQPTPMDSSMKIDCLLTGLLSAARNNNNNNNTNTHTHARYVTLAFVSLGTD